MAAVHFTTMPCKFGTDDLIALESRILQMTTTPVLLAIHGYIGLFQDIMLT